MTHEHETKHLWEEIPWLISEVLIKRFLMILNCLFICKNEILCVKLILLWPCKDLIFLFVWEFKLSPDPDKEDAWLIAPTQQYWTGLLKPDRLVTCYCVVTIFLVFVLEANLILIIVCIKNQVQMLDSSCGGKLCES